MRLSSLIVPLLVAFAGPSMAAGLSTDALGTRSFTILRDGQPIGSHTVSVTRDGRKIVAETQIDMDVYLAFVRVFHYTHRARETWEDGTLVAFESATNDDGTRYAVRAAAQAGQLKVSGDAVKATVPLGIVPTSYWNKALTSQRQLLNTQTGSILDARITRHGTERILAGGREIEATRYTLVSEFTLDLWYDARGQWVKSRFDARGSTIEYVLQPVAAPLQGASLGSTASVAFE